MTPGEIYIRSAVEGDRTIIRRSINRARLNPMGLTWQAFLIAEDERGRFLGCGQLKLHKDGSEELASLYVEPTDRGRGIAAKLIGALLARARKDIWLTCRTALVPFYNRYGFYEVLDPAQMPAYYNRVWRLFRVFTKGSEHGSGLSVMHWCPARQ